MSAVGESPRERARRRWIAVAAVMLALLAAGIGPQAVGRLFPIDVTGLPALRLASPGGGLSAVGHREIASTDLLSACAGARRPIAIIVSNEPSARPVSGLSQACLVYEVPIEAALPRLMAVYGDALPAIAGPVRSVRPAFLSIAAELDGIVAHAGQSAEALRAIRERRIPVVNEFWTPLPFHRTRDRRMPHNLYVDPGKVARWMSDRRIDAPTRQPSTGLTPDDPQGAPAVAIAVHHPPGYRTTFTFEDGVYRRAVDGAATVDAAGPGVEPTTVIVQSVRWRGWRRGKTDVSAVSTVDSGKALIFTRGLVVEARWEKTSDRAPTRFTTMSGSPLRFPGGPVWIVLARHEVKIEWK